jgi:hypothetical protein
MIPLQARIAKELKAPIPGPAREAARQLAALAKGGAAGVLFYGSGFRAGTLEGVLDFYVLVDRMRDWPSGPLVAWAGHELPPNVEYRDFPDLGVRAKVAIIELSAFADGVWTYSLDTTLWARFAQPCALAAVRGPEDRKAIEQAVGQAVATAAGWAATLGPARGRANDYWLALFAATYAAELRVEKTSRSGTILDHAEDRYAALLTEAWDAQGLAYERDGDLLAPRLSAAERRRARGGWRLRRWLGKPLNLARLAKACFTFEGAADYIVWKVGRHTGVKLPLTPWRRRHPLLSAPWALWRLWRAGVLR